MTILALETTQAPDSFDRTREVLLGPDVLCGMFANRGHRRACGVEPEPVDWSALGPPSREHHFRRPLESPRTRRAMYAWLCHEVRVAAHQWPRPRVFALGEALPLLEQCQESLGVRVVGGSLGDLLRGRVPRRSVAIAFAGDELSCMNDQHARAAVLAMFRCLASGGRLLLASLAWSSKLDSDPHSRDWSRVPRDVRQMRTLAERAPAEETERVDQSPDPSGMLCFTCVIRR